MVYAEELEIGSDFSAPKWLHLVICLQLRKMQFYANLRLGRVVDGQFNVRLRVLPLSQVILEIDGDLLVVKGHYLRIMSSIHPERLGVVSCEITYISAGLGITLLFVLIFKLF